MKEFGNGTASVQFSKEPNNLYNLNSYKHSGLTLSLSIILFGSRESFCKLYGSE